MWTAKNRGRYDRSALRYPSDLTDYEWELVEPLILPAKPGGNKRHVDVREVMNGIMGNSNNFHRSSGAPNSPANDSALFSFRFCAVPPKDVRESQVRQLFEVPIRERLPGVVADDEA